MGDRGEQRRQIAASQNYLGMARELEKVESLQQIITAIAAAHADQRGDVVALKEIVQLAQAAARAAGRIKITVKDIRRIYPIPAPSLQPSAITQARLPTQT